MNAPRFALTTPRRLVVGLLFFGAALAGCHKQAPPVAPTPAPITPPVRQQPAPVVTIASGNALVRAMHDAYPNWYKTLTFKQATTITRGTGAPLEQTWYEAALLPGRLRIDTDLAAKTGTLFAHDSIFGVSSGKLVRADTGLNELLVLGFDVYTQSAARTEAQLRRLGFDLSRIHEATWEGKPMYVVGAAPGDTMSKQFWVGKNDLLFVRLIERARQGRAEIRFENYVRAGQGWIAMRVRQIVNGKQTLLEEYSDVRTGIPVAEGLFNPRDWDGVSHWAKPSSPRR